jgi:hypothetical protein
MYTTAHRVWSRRTDQRGINAFLHRHDRSEDSVDWNAHDVLAVVTETIPGRLASESIQIAPGGNEVQSHLDVVAPDDTSLSEIQKALASAAKQISTSANLEVQTGHVWVGFGCQINFRTRAQAEFDALAAAVENVLVATPKPRTDGIPIRILVSNENGALVCRLDGAAIERVKALQGQPNEVELVGQVSATHAVIEDFNRIYGDITPELVSTLTRLTKDQLLAMGGFHFVDKKTNQILHTWPQPRE